MTELEALRRVAEAARKWRNAQHATEQYETFRALCAALDALAAVDDSPAPAAEPEGEVVKLSVLRGRLSGTYTASSTPEQEDPRDWVHVCNVRFVAPPLPRVPEVVGEVG